MTPRFSGHAMPAPPVAGQPGGTDDAAAASNDVVASTAVFERFRQRARALLAAGANRNLADRQGVTPLQHARSRGYAAMVALLEAGAAR